VLAVAGLELYLRRVPMCLGDEPPFSPLAGEGRGARRTEGVRRPVMAAGSKANFHPPFSPAPLCKPFMFLSPCLHSADFSARAELGCLHPPSTVSDIEGVFGLILRKAMFFSEDHELKPQVLMFPPASACHFCRQHCLNPAVGFCICEHTEFHVPAHGSLATPDVMCH